MRRIRQLIHQLSLEETAIHKALCETYDAYERKAAECKQKAQTIIELQDALALARKGVVDVEPTWTSERGITYRLSKMPLRYLLNVKGFMEKKGLHCVTVGGGLYHAVCKEIRKRG